ncbi:MAG TPA: winged helix DNA-binding protein [Allosphingosinicella sp.]
MRGILKARRLRERYFERDLFADPAWDIMLDLLAAKLEGRRVCVSSLCVAAAVPQTTGLRWIRLLGERGLIERSEDMQDGRRIYVSLSASAAERLTALLASVRSSCVPAL